MLKIGFLLTTIWFAGISLLFYWKWPNALDMDLSDWGGFLSGATAPVAFFWLVIGYLMQNQELKMNREVLQTQTEALLIQAHSAQLQADEISRQQVLRVLGESWEHRDNLKQGS